MGGVVYFICTMFFFTKFSIFSTDLHKNFLTQKYSSVDNSNFDDDNIDSFLKEDENPENPYIMKKRYTVLAERSLARAVLFPLYGQLYNWRVLGIGDYKKTLYFGLALGVALAFFIYNQARFIDSKSGSSNQNLYYRHRTYALSFLSIIYGLCIFDAYSSVHKYKSDFSSNLSVVEKIDPLI